MPAMISPALRVRFEMVAIPNGQWLIGCEECNWTPEPYFDETVATQDADQHNRDRHDGAAVDQFEPHPVLIARIEAAFANKRRKYARALALVHIAFPIGLIWWVWGGDWVTTFGMFSVIIAIRSFMWGLAREQYKHAAATVRQLENSLGYGQEEEGHD